MEENNVADITARLEAVAEALEAASQQLAERQISLLAEADAHFENRLGHITATIESREAELERKLAEAEERIAQLTAAASSGRKTVAGGVASLLTKQGISTDGGVAIAAGSLDGALTSLSLEQRIAVKAELMRAGLVA